MLTSFAIIFILGIVFGNLLKKINLPSLIGMIIVGIIIGPQGLGLIDDTTMDISPVLRQVALIIILTRAGLALNIEDLKKVGRPAILMCFIPATIEMIGVVLIAPKLLNVTFIEAALIGSVIAAVSPAVVVPRMIHLIENGYGKEHSIPQLILAGASVDDVFVIVVFTVFTSLIQTGKINAIQFVNIPISIILGIMIGVFVGYGLSFLFSKVNIQVTEKMIFLLSSSFILIGLQNLLENTVPFSGLIAIMVSGIVIHQKSDIASDLSKKYNQLWVGAEIILFVLVGACVDLSYALSSGIVAILVVCFALVFRMIGVFFCLLGTNLTKKERLFCMIAYTPKATVQAAIGAIPLSMGLKCGNIVLTVAVLSILITAPFGAICIDKLYKKLLNRDSAFN